MENCASVSEGTVTYITLEAAVHAIQSYQTGTERGRRRRRGLVGHSVSAMYHYLL